jgi:hypothetical protein
MKKSVSFLISFVLIILAFSCSKIDDVQNAVINYNNYCASYGYSTNNEHIKFVSSNGAIQQLYLYNDAGKIVEESGGFYFQRYLYDKNDLLVKTESAFDGAIFSSNSSALAGRTEFMTSQNSAVKNYTLYEYDNEYRVSKTEYYSNMTGNGFEHRSTWTFEYEGVYIVKVNGCEPTGEINQFWIYEYDNRGNVINEKNYACMFSTEPQLISETTYKYDNHKNPYHIFSNMKGLSQAFYNSVNNIIESNVIIYSKHFSLQLCM